MHPFCRKMSGINNPTGSSPVFEIAFLNFIGHGQKGSDPELVPQQPAIPHAKSVLQMGKERLLFIVENELTVLHGVTEHLPAEMFAVHISEQGCIPEQ